MVLTALNFLSFPFQKDFDFHNLTVEKFYFQIGPVFHDFSVLHFFEKVTKTEKCIEGMPAEQ